jgi:uncharacterized protein
MSVIKRLQRLTGETPEKTEKSSRRSEIEALRKRMDMIMARRPEQKTPVSVPPGRRLPPLEDVVPGAEYRNAAGTCFVLEHIAMPSTRHGYRCIGDFAGVSMKAAGLMANSTALADCLPEEGLFLDTETTGLAGGTGTMAFLIGLGWFDRDRFITRQIFARDFSEERAALSLLADIAGSKRFLVSFNGKTFDVGLLSTRFIMNRLPHPLAQMPHLDLLYPARRLMARRLDNCRLATLEARVLGLVREDDLPGCEIPQRYFDWLRQKDGLLMSGVFVHNRLDVISLAALMDRLAALIHGLPDTAGIDNGDLLAVARFCSERGKPEQARDLLSTLQDTGETSIRMEARKMLSLMYKRAGRWQEAVALWNRMNRDRPDDFFAVTELAKWYEHQADNRTAALDLVEQLLQRSSGRMKAGEWESLLHRRERLQKHHRKSEEIND